MTDWPQHWPSPHLYMSNLGGLPVYEPMSVKSIHRSLTWYLVGLECVHYNVASG